MILLSETVLAGFVAGLSSPFPVLCNVSQCLYEYDFHLLFQNKEIISRKTQSA